MARAISHRGVTAPGSGRKESVTRWVTAARPVRQNARMSEPDDVPEFLKGGGPVINADGHVEGKVSERIERIEQLPEAPSDAPLELQARAPKPSEPMPSAYRDPVVDLRRRRALRVVIAALVLGCGLIAATLFAPKPTRQALVDTVRDSTVLDQLAGGGGRAPLVISSEPSGATVRIAGEKVGVTPWAGDNVWEGATAVELQLPGYQPWKGSIRGGEEAHLNARLTK
jgi:PEGA domain